jgi:GntR family transcriptional regulator
MDKTTDKPVSIARIKHATLTDQTVQAIQDAIRQGKFPPGSQLPPEMELLQMLGISRTTLREALRVLEEQGLIRKRRGLGTFVLELPIIKDMSRNFGITEMISQAGFIPGSRDFDVRLEKPTKSVMEKLSIQATSSLVVVERVRTANGKPVVFTRDMLPQEYLGGWMPAQAELSQRSIYEYLELFVNLRITSGTASLRPILANREVADKLEIQRNDLLLLIDQVDLDQDQRPVLYSAEYHLPDKFNFIIHRKGPFF